MKDNTPVILQSMQRFNILPITSHCDSNCIFCSHKQNPPNVETYTFNREFTEIVESLEYLDKNKKIVIGESATKLIEGEPFLNPKFLDILKILRTKFLETPVTITTNGNFLNEENIALLKKLEPLEINISVNAITLKNRKLLMGKNAKDILPALKSLKKYNITYHGSLVAMPWLTGWEEIEKTVEAFEEYNATTVRVFLPGYTKLAPENLKFPHNLWDELSFYISDLRKKFRVPISLEPPKLKDLTPEVVGVIKDSPAEKAGLKPEDIISEVNGRKAFSRVEAFNEVKKALKADLKIERKGTFLNLELSKLKESSQSGIVMDFDIAPETIEEILFSITKYKAQNILLLSSKLGFNVLKKALERHFLEDKKLYLKATDNLFFGGSIMAAGLLVVEDFKNAYKDWRKEHPKERLDLILLPGIAFDFTGKDLLGTPYWELAELTDSPIVVI